MLTLDGSHGEGGGSIVRVATALAALTKTPLRIENIRSGRENPGLRAQHAEAISAIAQLCNAEAKGNEVGSGMLEFTPQEIKHDEIKIKIPTAGSVGLLLQSFLIAASHSGARLRIDGGATNGKWAAPVLYMQRVLLPLLEKLGYSAGIHIEKYGYYPKGGAQVNAEMKPAHFQPADLMEKGKLLRIEGVSHASKLLQKANVAGRQQVSCKNALQNAGVPVNIEINYVDTLNPGSAVDLWAVFENSVVGGDALGERGKSAESVGEEAAKSLLAHIRSDAAVDMHAEDMLIPYMALAAAHGESRIKVPAVTMHTKTNIWVTEKFLPVKFEIDEAKKTVSCKNR